MLITAHSMCTYFGIHFRNWLILNLEFLQFELIPILAGTFSNVINNDVPTENIWSQGPNSIIYLHRHVKIPLMNSNTLSAIVCYWWTFLASFIVHHFLLSIWLKSSIKYLCVLQVISLC